MPQIEPENVKKSNTVKFLVIFHAYSAQVSIEFIKVPKQMKKN